MSFSDAKCRVLFVCLGNICRSPAADIVLTHQVKTAGLEGCYEIDSAGTIGHHQGAPPDARMAATLEERGYLIHGQARKIQASDLVDFDWIITMDESNHDHVCSLDPEGQFLHKIRPFVSFCKKHDDDRVPDPYYGGQSGFEHVADLLVDGCEGILEDLESWRAAER